MEKGVLQDRGNVFRQEHQVLEVVIIERLPGEAVAKKEPADDPAARVQRHNHFGAESIEGAPHHCALRGIRRVGEIAPADQVGVKFEPAHQRIALAVFDLVGFRKAAQARAQPIAIALPDARKNSDAGNTRRIGHALDQVGEQRFHVIESAEDAREAQQRHRAGQALWRRVECARCLRQGDETRLAAQFSILLRETQMIESARDQRLQATAIQVQILRGVNAGLLRFAQRFRAWCAESRDQDFRPFLLNLINQIAGVFRPQIGQEERGTGLLQDGIQTIRLGNMPHLGEDAEECLDPAREIALLRVDDANRRSAHAAATSSSKRTSGRRMWKAVPFASSLSTSICPPCS